MVENNDQTTAEKTAKSSSTKGDRKTLTLRQKINVSSVMQNQDSVTIVHKKREYSQSELEKFRSQQRYAAASNKGTQAAEQKLELYKKDEKDQSTGFKSDLGVKPGVNSNTSAHLPQPPADLSDSNNTGKGKKTDKYNSVDEDKVVKDKPKNIGDSKKLSKEQLVRQLWTSHDDTIPTVANKKHRGKNAPKTYTKIFRTVNIPPKITIADLAMRMSEKGKTVIQKLRQLGHNDMHIGDYIDADLAELVTGELGHVANVINVNDNIENKILYYKDKSPQIEPCPPIVTVMGHVDHGKTTLLDAIRKTHVAGGEAGGITQHIGAYQITTSGGQKITFIDTPGHEAFTAMRARGAQMTNIVILVVAADDGIKDQTKEAIHHAKSAQVPIIVALNKIDAKGSNPNKVISQLAEQGVMPDSLGGDNLFVQVSAKNKTNIDELEENVLLQSELLELSAPTNTKHPQGIILEVRQDKKVGNLVSLLVSSGTLKTGAIIVAGTCFGKIRTMKDHDGNVIKAATPSTPVEVLCFSEMPNAGDGFAVVDNEKQANELVKYRLEQQRKQEGEEVAYDEDALLSYLLPSIEENSNQEIIKLSLIVKADTGGTIEAIRKIVGEMEQENVKIKIIHDAVGGVSISDVDLACSAGAMLVAFNVKADSLSCKNAAEKGVTINYYKVIYDIQDDITAIIEGKQKENIIEEVELGTAVVREVYPGKNAVVYGCHVNKGKVKSKAKVRIIRGEKVIHEGAIKSLRRFKDDVTEVAKGLECGLSVDNYQDAKIGDTLEVFEIAK